MAYDAFLKIDGFTDSQNNGQGLQLESFSFGAANPSGRAAGGGGGAGKRSAVLSLNVTRFEDAFSPSIFNALAQGKLFHKATLTLSPRQAPTTSTNAATSSATLFYKLQLLLFLKLDDVGHPTTDEAAPLESLTLNFLKLDFSAASPNNGG